MTRSHKPRSAARLAVVQGLYQIHVAGMSPTDVVHAYKHHGLGIPDGVEPDHDFFHRRFHSAVDALEKIDEVIKANLGSNWRIERLEALILSILRAGVDELMHEEGIPIAVTIDEYVDVTHAFYAGKEAAFVNNCLDRIGKLLHSST